MVNPWDPERYVLIHYLINFEVWTIITKLLSSLRHPAPRNVIHRDWSILISLFHLLVVTQMAYKFCLLYFIGCTNISKEVKYRLTQTLTVFTLNILHHTAMAQCKTAVTPLLTHWSYCSLALSPRFIAVCFYNYTSDRVIICNTPHLRHGNTRHITERRAREIANWLLVQHLKVWTLPWVRGLVRILVSTKSKTDWRW